jgi:hypothetical protein
VLNPLTFGFGGASGGKGKNAVTPTTLSQEPMRHSQSAASADRQTIRFGVGLFIICSRTDNAGSRSRNKNPAAKDTLS